MHALVNTAFGPTGVLKLLEQKPSPLGTSQVRIAVKRAGLNFADVAARVGLYPDAPKPPMVMGYEVSGVITEVGTAVGNLSVGQRVLAMCRFGGQATEVTVDESTVAPIDDAMSFDSAAALPVNYLTAFHLLFEIAPLRPGMRVLIQMAAGGVGLAAIELCQTVPNVEIFACASKEKHAFLKQKGVQHCIDYKTQDYQAYVSHHTNGKGVHRVLDALGGKDWKKGFQLLCKSGHLLCFGWANMVSGSRRNPLHVLREFLSLKRYSPMELMDRNASVSGVNLGHLWDETALLKSHLTALLELYRQGKIAPHVDQVFSLAQGADAHAYLQARRNIGKVLFNCELHS